MSSRPHNSHADFQDLLEKHIAGLPLSPSDRITLFDHLETCDQCRVILEAEERVTARMKAVPKLVAPSDLRAKILTQALRDHRERTTTPSEDPTVSDILRPRETPEALPPSPPAPTPALAAVMALSDISRNEPQDELPVFVGITRPQVSRTRRVWRRASPVLAMAFLATASIGALYTGQFQGIPLAAEAQQIVWNTLDRAMGKAPLPEASVMIADSAPLLFPPDTASEIIQSKTQLLLEASSQVAAPAPPLPGTESLIHTVQGARSVFQSLNSTAEALARAAEVPIPGPAEKSAPQIAALILRPTDLPANAGGFQQSELASALEGLADSQGGARLAAQDQFAQGGHRYRLYTLELPAGSTSRIMENLNPYQAPEDGQIITTLASQNFVSPTASRPVRFFSSNGQHLRSALQSLPTASAASRSEMIRFVVVE